MAGRPLAPQAVEALAAGRILLLPPHRSFPLRSRYPQLADGKWRGDITQIPWGPSGAFASTTAASKGACIALHDTPYRAAFVGSDSFAARLVDMAKKVGIGSALPITLERSTLAPMEGELQLWFSYKSSLCVLTFLLASGDVFDVGHSSVLFVGGVQVSVGRREEVREAARLNGEIAPSTMLLLAVQAIGRAFGVGEIIGIGENDHVSLGYARSKVVFDYRRI